MKINIIRSYDIAHYSKDSSRYLVDRKWPRGIKKEVLQLDQWLKELSPSNELCKWFNHEADKWEEFKEKYFLELNTTAAELDKFVISVKNEKEISFIFSSKDYNMNNAIALKEFVLHALKAKAR